MEYFKVLKRIVENQVQLLLKYEQFNNNLGKLYTNINFNGDENIRFEDFEKIISLIKNKNGNI